MRLVIQKVSEASVKVDGDKIADIGQGLLILLGIEHEDDESDADWLCEKTCGQWWWHVLDWYPCILLCNTLALKTMASLTYRKCFVFFFSH